MSVFSGPLTGRDRGIANRRIFSYDTLFFCAFLFHVGALLLELCVWGEVFFGAAWLVWVDHKGLYELWLCAITFAAVAQPGRAPG